MATPVFLVILVINLVCANDFEREGREGFIDRLSGGMKFASDFLASESVASKVAEFVVRAFQTANTANQHQHMPTPNSPTHHQHSPTPNRRRPIFSEAYEDASSENLAEENRPNNSVNEAPSPMTPLKYLVKLIGLQPNQISAVAVNALVFVAQMISTFLAGPPRPSKPYRTEDPTSWILNKNSRSLQDLLERAKNESILHDIDEAIKQQDEDTSCIRLLVCKITPFVHKMQDAVFDKDNITDNLKGLRGADIMYRHLPTSAEIRESGDTCEQKHKDCDLSE